MEVAAVAMVVAALAAGATAVGTPVVSSVAARAPEETGKAAGAGTARG